jgi:spoIIIJ-associated protein
MHNDLIHTTLTELLTALGIQNATIEQVPLRSYTLWNIQTEDTDTRHFRGDGEELRALTYILRRLLERRGVPTDTHITLDINGHQQAHILDLEQKARLLGERVRTFRSSAEMAPMNSYERMIIHALFSDDKEVETISLGEGPSRHVVIRYRAEQ